LDDSVAWRRCGEAFYHGTGSYVGELFSLTFKKVITHGFSHRRNLADFLKDVFFTLNIRCDRRGQDKEDFLCKRH